MFLAWIPGTFREWSKRFVTFAVIFHILSYLFTNTVYKTHKVVKIGSVQFSLARYKLE